MKDQIFEEKSEGQDCRPDLDSGFSSQVFRILLSHKKEWHFAICNNMGVMLSEISQTEKDKCYMWSLNCGMWKINKWL